MRGSCNFNSLSLVQSVSSPTQWRPPECKWEPSSAITPRRVFRFPSPFLSRLAQCMCDNYYSLFIVCYYELPSAVAQCGVEKGDSLMSAALCCRFINQCQLLLLLPLFIRFLHKLAFLQLSSGQSLQRQYKPLQAENLIANDEFFTSSTAESRSLFFCRISSIMAH